MTEERDADVLDATIDAVADGVRPPADADERTVALVGHLAVLQRWPVPETLERRVVRRRPVRLARLLAAVLAASFLLQAGPALAAPAQMAEFLGFLPEAHLFREAGILALGIAIGLLVGVARPRWLPAALSVGVPAGVGLAVFGLLEISHAPNPGAELFHVGQGVVAAAAAVVWLARRSP